jgi:hypothetical protein
MGSGPWSLGDRCEKWVLCAGFEGFEAER